MKYIEALLCLRRAKGFFIVEEVNRIEKHRVNALSRKMLSAVCSDAEHTSAPAADVSEASMRWCIPLFQCFS